MSVEEIRAFVRDHPQATAMEIRDGLGQKTENDTIYCFDHPDKRKGRAFFIQDVSHEFYANMKEFMRADDVEVRESTLEHLISDRQMYQSRPGLHYLPITLTLK